MKCKQEHFYLSLKHGKFLKKYNQTITVNTSHHINLYALNMALLHKVAKAKHEQLNTAFINIIFLKYST